MSSDPNPRNVPVLVHGEEITSSDPFEKGESTAAYYGPLETSNELWALPPGWTTARQQADGRIYYYKLATGRMSWSHPMALSSNDPRQDAQPAAPTPQSTDLWGDPTTRRTGLLDTPMNASRRPDNHQFYSCLALILCFPLGVMAMFNSYRVDQAWTGGRYGDAVNHSRQASRFAWFAIFLGVVILLVWWMRWSDFEFPDFDFDFDG